MTKTEFATEAQRRRDEGLKVFGAYALRDQIKAQGGIFDGRLKCWLIPSHDTARSLDLVAKSGQHGTYYVSADSISKPPRSRPSRQPREPWVARHHFLDEGDGECMECGHDYGHPSHYGRPSHR